MTGFHRNDRFLPDLLIHVGELAEKKKFGNVDLGKLLTLPRMVTSKMTQQFIVELFVSVGPDPSMSYFS